MVSRKPMVLVNGQIKAIPDDDVITSSSNSSRTGSLNSLRLREGEYNGHHVYVNGFADGYSGQDGITYYWDSTSVESENVLTIIKATGITTGRWKALIQAPGLSVKFFGAVGDGVTDDTNEIQQAIDCALRCKIPNIYIPGGIYKTNGPIHLGYGNSFYTINMIGEDSNAFGDIGFPGVIIDASGFSNAPAIVFQGGRNSSIQNITIKGPSYRYGLLTWGPLIDTQAVSYTEVSNHISWVTNITENGLTRYAPCAGIAIDPYSGAAPGLPYPQVNYPDWTGIVAQYNKASSSNTRIINCTIDGFYIGVANQPNGDSNGDFTTIDGGSIFNCSHGLSIGNTQSRNVSMRNTTIQYLHTLVSTDLIGAQNGVIGGTISNVSGGLMFQLYSFTNGIAGPVSFEHFYAEGMIRLGITDDSATRRFAITMRQCKIGYVGWITGSVTEEIYNVPFCEGAQPVVFEECLVGFRGDFALIGGRATPIYIRWSGIQAWAGGNSTLTTDRMKLAYNFLVGGAPALDGKLEGEAMVIPIVGLASPNPVYSLSSTINGSRAQVNIYAERIQHDVGDMGPIIQIQANPKNSAGSIDFSTFVSPSFDPSTRLLTFTYLNAYQANYNRLRIVPGCVFWHENSNALFVVDTVTLSGNAVDWDIESLMVTNYQIDNDGYYSEISPVAMTGPLWLYQTFHKITGSQFIGDLSTGSAVVSNIRRANGDGSTVPTDFKAGDLMFASDRHFNERYWAATTISTTGSGTITLSYVAKVTETSVPIELYR